VSGRKGGFVAVNCAALGTDLAASELFGHARGAFSGATAGRSGLFRAAEGGSLLLDEIGDLPIELQGHLLRTLQEGTVRAVGSDVEEAVDVRVLAATHVDLDEAERQGQFRGDLLARLAHVVLDVPPLRARRCELIRLTREFAPGLTLTPNAAEALLIADWPGNVRALRALIEAHGAMQGSDTVLARDLVARLSSARTVLNRASGTEPPAPPSATHDRRKRLVELLRKHDGNISQVAREFGKPRAQIYRWLRTLGLSKRGES
jgi:transcriptional regulator with GAF, ATPase, and Fis domain